MKLRQFILSKKIMFTCILHPQPVPSVQLINVLILIQSNNKSLGQSQNCLLVKTPYETSLDKTTVARWEPKQPRKDLDSVTYI